MKNRPHEQETTTTTSYRLETIPVPIPAASLTDREQAEWNNGFTRCNNHIHVINGLLQFLFSRHNLTAIDKHSIFSYLLNLYEKDKETVQWPNTHPLQADFYMDKRSKASQAKDAFSLGYSQQEQDMIFPVFLIAQWDLNDFGGKIINEVQLLANCFKAIPSHVPESTHEAIERISTKKR